MHFSTPTQKVRIIHIEGPCVVPEGKIWKVTGLAPYESERGVGTADLYIDGQIWIGESKAYNISGKLEILINSRQDNPIWIIGGSSVHRGDSRDPFDVEEYPQAR